MPNLRPHCTSPPRLSPGALFVFLALVGLVQSPPGIQAQDVVPPVVTQAQADLFMTTNGNPLTVRVSATANEPSIFEVTCTYASSYPLYHDEPDPHWVYKTAAVGEHQGVSASLSYSVSNLQVAVGPRTYHSDTLAVHVVAIDAAGNRSDPLTALQTTIEMPLGAVPQPQGDHYGFTAIHLGGSRPGSGTISEWAEADVIICSPQHLLGTHGSDASSFHHWVHQVRELPGSRNVAVIGFAGGMALWNNHEIPVARRAYQLFDNIYRDAKANASPDTNVLGHLVDGSLAVVYQRNVEVGSRLVNITYPAARDTLAWFFVNEWNHYDNRLANVGLMFDVWEYVSEYAIVYQGQTVFSGYYLDRDLDGVPMRDDLEEQVAVRDGRIAFIQDLRRRLHESAEDPAVGRHFLIGGNSVAARSDATMAALLDHLFIEDYQCPRGCGTGLGLHPFHHALDPTYVRSEFPSYSLLHPDVVPYPPDFTSDWVNLAAAMRDSAGGPFITLESRGTCGGEMMDPVFNDVYSLLVDDVYPIWTGQHPPLIRIFRSPSQDGLADLRALGRATGSFTATPVNDGGLLWQRPYQYGEVEIVIAEEDGFDCDRGDRFEYRVTLNGTPARLSPNWGPPTVEGFFVTGWDSAGSGGAVRLHLIALASEPSVWERSGRSAEGAWSEPEATQERGLELAEAWNTGFLPESGDIRVRVRARDEAGQRSGWSEVTVPINRFGGFGVEILQTRVLGTAYGLPRPGGAYEVLGLSSEAPDLAPPHYLEITGTVSEGFTPVRVRWQNSLGGEGWGKIVSVSEGRWQIAAVELFRGVNEITIVCFDQHGQHRQGALLTFWDHPGQPGTHRP
jgi:hypothetical protein